MCTLKEARLTVETTARDMVRRLGYSQDMLSLIPDDLMGKILCDENLINISEEIDDKCGIFEKEKQLGKLFSIRGTWKTKKNKELWQKVISKAIPLTKEQEDMVDQIRFIFQLVSTIAHL